MEWLYTLKDAPKRVNHAAVIIDEKIYSFGGYINGGNFEDTTVLIDIFFLDTRELSTL